MENGGRGSGGVELRMTNLRFFFPKSKLAHNHRKRKAIMYKKWTRKPLSNGNPRL